MKSTVEIIVSGINNLTDARYFSAMGVQWMSFDLRKEPRPSIELMQAIMDWVEGPSWLIELPEVDSNYALDGVKGMIAPKVVPHSTFEIDVLRAKSLAANETARQLLLDLSDLNEDEVANQLRAIARDSTLWVEAHWTPTLIQTAMQNASINGVVVQAGTELEVGLKNYEALDQLFEAMSS